jgi:hypothetical protein
MKIFRIDYSRYSGTATSYGEAALGMTKMALENHGELQWDISKFF